MPTGRLPYDAWNAVLASPTVFGAVGASTCMVRSEARPTAGREKEGVVGRTSAGAERARSIMLAAESQARRGRSSKNSSELEARPQRWHPGCESRAVKSSLARRWRRKLCLRLRGALRRRNSTAPVVRQRPAVEHAPSEEAAYAALARPSTVRVGEEALAACAQPPTRCRSSAARNRDADVTPGVYEGGFKIWECALDLLEVMEARRAAGCRCRARARARGGLRRRPAGRPRAAPRGARRSCSRTCSEVLRTTTMATLRRGERLGGGGARRRPIRQRRLGERLVEADRRAHRAAEHRRRALEGTRRRRPRTSASTSSSPPTRSTRRRRRRRCGA